MFPSLQSPSSARAHSARHSNALTSSGSVRQADMYYRLARPPERLTSVPVREFTVGAALTDPRLRTSRARPAYDPLRDPHLASFWARHSMLPDVRKNEHKRKQNDVTRTQERSDYHRARCEDRTADDLAALAAKRYSRDRDQRQDTTSSPIKSSPSRTPRQKSSSASPNRPIASPSLKAHNKSTEVSAEDVTSTTSGGASPAS